MKLKATRNGHKIILKTILTVKIKITNYKINMKINLQILDKSTQKFVFEKTVDIPFIPRKEEKFVHQDKEGHNYVYQVHDLFYSENNVEILLIKISTVSEYHQSLGLHLF